MNAVVFALAVPFTYHVHLTATQQMSNLPVLYEAQLAMPCTRRETF